MLRAFDLDLQVQALCSDLHRGVFDLEVDYGDLPVENAVDLYFVAGKIWGVYLDPHVAETFHLIVACLIDDWH